MSYYSLHVHTDVGSNSIFLDSIAKPKELVKYARSQGLLGLACSDHASLSAWINFLQERDKIKEEGADFKIMLGVEAYLIDESEYKNTKTFPHFLVLARNLTGAKQLFSLTSKSWDRSYMERGVRRVPMFYKDFEELEEKGNLIVTNACAGGLLARKILEHDTKGAGQFLSWCVNTFGRENFFLEIQPNDHSEEQKIINRAIIKISRQTGIPYIITTDVHYCKPSQKDVHSAFLNSREARGFRETAPFYDYTTILTPQEIIDVMKNMDISEEETREGLQNTHKVAALIEDFDIRKDTIVPQRKLPNFELENILAPWYDTHPTIKYFSESPYEQDRFLLYLVERGMKEKNLSIGQVEADRLETEFDVLKCLSESMGQRMSAYLNLVQEIVDVGWNVSFVGASRGSAMSFFINYVIGLTQINPIPYNVPYWRFLNKASVQVDTGENVKKTSAASTLADCDLDFSPAKANEIMDAFREHYGKDCVINTLTFKTESLKSAVKTACRGLGISNEEAQVLSNMVPVSRGHVYSLDECEFGNEERGYEPVPAFIQQLNSYSNLYDTVREIEGLVSGISQHASAVYWCEGSFLNYCGVECTARGTRVTCFDYRGVDACGGLKVDILLTEIQTKLMKCMELMLKAGVMEWQGSLRATYNKYLHPDVIQYDNPVIWDAICSGRQIQNIFQFEGQVGVNCLRRTRPRNVLQLAASNSVMRLMAQDGGETPIDRYARFRDDISLWYKEMDEYGLTKEEQATLEKYLVGSFGCSVDQETLVLLCLDEDIAGFSLRDGNLFRKKIAKKDAAGIEKYKKKFFEVADDE